ncbi:MAG: M48 family metalloprotease, partial [Alphaproteobacteria bacterium]
MAKRLAPYRRFLLSFCLLAAFALGGVALPGCSVNPATGEQSFTAFMSPERERQIGAEEHPKLVKAFGGKYQDASLVRYVNGLGALLQSTSEQPKPPFTFTLLDSPVINAFAVPGGYVYVSRGLMALANDEAELAGVVAHEIGHVTARHSAQRMSRGVLASLGVAVLGAAVGEPLLGDAARLAAGAYIQGYSREQEFEADQLGVRYLTRAGFDPMAMASFLATLGAEHGLALKIAGTEGRDPAAGLFSSHPRTAARVEKAAASARSGAQTGLARDADIYLNQIDGMIYGDSPRHGYVRGREFDHAELKFRFTAPPGFRLHNSEAAVLGEHSGGALMRFDGRTLDDPTQSTQRYLTRVWAKGLNFSGVETIEING